ncbi:acyl-CoA:lysophosphatidylglycerol acyltransferase 1 isoform X2 [Amyelois transitella]|uniref:acyl-CoA:lysophosphatidylglycerol acyltransferase 1 isoform X2 n=1 Tax=Amyelois transitella TaxID=680683 RepID=UPI00298FB014|nr:acyl-CoA:lysophosphatidylglycerol acyltransferase 1 isoform X2 [Amyelois transitella]
MPFLQYVRIVARTTFTIVNNLYCVPAYVVWMMMLRLVRPLYAPIYWKIEGLMYHWLLAMVSLWAWTAGYEIVETGDDPVACMGRRTLVLANHQSTGDVPLLMTTWNPRPGVLSNLMWIMDRVFKFTNFGIVSVLHEDFFIQAGKAKREQSLDELREHIHKSYIPLGRQFMVLFPEGGFLHKRREISQRFAEKNNLPKLEYVSLPRAGAMKVILEEMGPLRDEGASTSKGKKDDNFNQSNSRRKSLVNKEIGDTIEWILDVTIAYPDRIPLHLQDIVCGIRPPCSTHIHYRLYPCTDVPADTEGMTNWLYDRFVEKDKMLEEYYRTGKFPSNGPTANVQRTVRQDNLRYLILHLFFIASTLIQLKVYYYLITLFYQ